jgi:hypothetical protein
VQRKSRNREYRLPKKKIPFQKEYCAQLIEHMKTGATFKSFSQVINVSYSTIHRWTVDIREFDQAKAEGEKFQMLKKGWK